MKIEDLKKANVLVCGDAMIDRYWFGDAERLSPETPVPVVKIKRMDTRLGGAANVALNAAKLGAVCSLLAVVGDDADGKQLTAMLEAAGVKPCLSIGKAVPTTVKLRIVARQQQMVRCDFEESPEVDTLSKLQMAFMEEIQAADVLILSDYRKGVLNHASAMIAAAKMAKLPIMVDPKGDDWSQYRGATLITPNRAELRRIVGAWSNEADLRLRAQCLRESLELEHLLLTRSEEGMTLFSAGEEVNFKAQAREVFDVSGAGDTVIAVLATLISAGVELKEAVRLANKAGGIVVGKLGTAALTFQELFERENFS